MEKIKTVKQQVFSLPLVLKIHFVSAEKPHLKESLEDMASFQYYYKAK